MRNLPREVVAAIETAVQVNNGALESAYIHSLAKIYKTSPQAVVWNMKRWNKVQAGCDDRKPGGPPAAMDKDKAAEFLREFMAEIHTEGKKIKMDDIAVKLSEKFGQEISGSWVSRIMKKYSIPHKEPKPPKVKKVRVPKAPKPPKPSKTPEQPVQSSWNPHYNLPAPGQYPSFREDLQQALVGDSRRSVVEPPMAAAPPPAAKRSRPPNAPDATPNEGHTADFDGFGILKPSKTTPAAPALPPMSTQNSFAHQYHHPRNIYPRLAPIISSSHGSPTASEFSNSTPTPTESSSSTTNKSSNVNLEILKVVELP